MTSQRQSCGSYTVRISEPRRAVWQLRVSARGCGCEPCLLPLHVFSLVANLLRRHSKEMMQPCLIDMSSLVELVNNATKEMVNPV